MKPILHFEISYGYPASVKRAEVLKDCLMEIKDKLSDNYDVIVSPMRLTSGGTNIKISPSTNLDDIMEKINEVAMLESYDFHHRYMPHYEFTVINDTMDIDSLHTMNEFWYPVTAMTNYTEKPNFEILNILKMRNINPFEVSAIRNRKHESDGVHIELNDAVKTGVRKVVTFNEYLVWMIDQINTSSVKSIDVLNIIDSAHVNPWMVVSVSDKDGGFPFTLIDENLIIKYRDKLKDSTGLYILAANQRRSNRRKRNGVVDK